MKKQINLLGKGDGMRISINVSVEEDIQLSKEEFRRVVMSVQDGMFNLARKDHGYGFTFHCHELRFK